MRNIEIQDLLQLARKKGATDIHIVSGVPAFFRIDRKLIPASSNALRPAAAKHLCYSLLNENQIMEFEKTLHIDLMLPDEQGNRYRINLCYNNGDIGAVIRLLPKSPIPRSAVIISPPR